MDNRDNLLSSVEACAASCLVQLLCLFPHFFFQEHNVEVHLCILNIKSLRFLMQQITSSVTSGVSCFGLMQAVLERLLF